MVKVAKFYKGETYHLDTVYKWLSLLPSDSYFQQDPSDDGLDSDTSSEEVTMVKDVTIKVEVIVK